MKLGPNTRTVYLSRPYLAAVSDATVRLTQLTGENVSAREVLEACIKKAFGAHPVLAQCLPNEASIMDKTQTQPSEMERLTEAYHDAA
jgi:hypothetical protein